LVLNRFDKVFNDGMSDYAEKLFTIRSLNKDLNSELSAESLKENKNKNKL
jgi:hypothetical protein